MSVAVIKFSYAFTESLQCQTRRGSTSRSGRSVTTMRDTQLPPLEDDETGVKF